MNWAGSCFRCGLVILRISGRLFEKENTTRFMGKSRARHVGGVVARFGFLSKMVGYGDAKRLHSTTYKSRGWGFHF